MSRSPRLAGLAGLIALSCVALSGCYLYVDEHDGDGWSDSYCDDSGCYTCDDYGCYPDGGAGGEGSACDSNYDCEAGCYCNDAGTCEEGDFCSSDRDCPDGFECDDRSSCVPEGSDADGCDEDSDCPEASFCDEGSGQCIGSWECNQDDQCAMGYTCDEDRKTCIPAPCESDADCLEGCYCDENSGQCVETSMCGADGSCPEGMECDEERNTCEPDLAGPVTCQGEVTCDTNPPACAQGTVPAIQDGCYTGECLPDAQCPDGTPVECRDRTTENGCLNAEGCDAVYRGLNCTDPEGQSCTSGDADCDCESFVFDECEDAA